MWQDEEIRDGRALNTKMHILVRAKMVFLSLFLEYLCKIVGYEKVQSDS